MIKLIQLAKELKEKLGVDTWYVGGCVRDEILGIPVDDIDICLSNVKDSLHIYRIIKNYLIIFCYEQLVISNLYFFCIKN